jgi:hypothetical protein
MNHTHGRDFSQKYARTLAGAKVGNPAYLVPEGATVSIRPAPQGGWWAVPMFPHADGVDPRAVDWANGPGLHYSDDQIEFLEYDGI